MTKSGIIILLAIAVIASVVYRNQLLLFLGNAYFALTSSPVEKQEVHLGERPATESDSEEKTIEIVAENLRIPWEIVFLPDDSLLVTERQGSIVRLLPNERKSIPISGVEHVGEGGLLGLALHPEYQNNQWLYMYHTTRSTSGLINRVERYTFDETNNSLSNRQVILDNIPASTNHDGGRLVFGPDNLLYITTGDAGNASAAQDTQSLAGKILRVNDDGSIPENNPFGNEVFSYGHRNPQGLSWDTNGQLWSTEHGPSGASSGFDEVNVIQRAGNYGWPEIQGDETRSGMISPVMHSGRNETWAPADSLVVDSLLFFPGLRGQSLYSSTINSTEVNNRVIHFKNEFGRLRVTRISPDNEWIYIATSNRDGRGRPTEGDDKIIRINKNWFLQKESENN